MPSRFHNSGLRGRITVLSAALALTLAMAVGCAPRQGSHGPHPGGGGPGAGSRAQAAPRPPGPEQRADELMKQLISRAGLSKEQAEAARAIVLDQARQKDALFKKYEQVGARQMQDEIMPALRRIDQETSDKLARVLSEDQLAQYCKIVEEQRKRMRPPSSGGRHGRPGGPGGGPQ